MKLGLRSVFAIGILLYSCDGVLAGSRDGEFEPIKEINGVPVTLRPLDNNKCTKIKPDGKKEKVFRNRKDDEQQVKGIVVHYSVCPNADFTERVFYSNGVSSHYDVDFDGKKFEFVDPKYVAFHAGKSAWDGLTSLNKFFIGIAQDMWGYYESNLEQRYDYKKFGKPVQLPGDDRKWFKFSDEQIKSTGQLIFALQQEYKIPGRFVVTHSDVAIGRKSDSGPMFPYKKIFEEYGAGYYPESKYINLTNFPGLTNDDYVKLLEIYGYNKGENGKAFDLTDNQIIKAFKLHFYPGDLSEELNDNTKKKIINLISDYYNYKDLITHSLDYKFRNDIDSFFSENKERTQELSDFVLGWNSYTKLKSNFLWISDFFRRFTDIFRKVDEKVKLK